MIDSAAVAVEGVGFPPLTLATRGWIVEALQPSVPLPETLLGSVVTVGGSQYVLLTTSQALAAGLALSGASGFAAADGALGASVSLLNFGGSRLLMFDLSAVTSALATAGGSMATAALGGVSATVTRSGGSGGKLS